MKSCAGKFAFYFFTLLGAALLFSASAAEKNSLIGKQPPEWTVTHWIHSAPLQLKDLRGKVVLVRWWTAPDCPYCKASAPALNDFYEKYKSRGLQVLGFYHHKSSAPLEAQKVKTYAENLGFQFPVAIDVDWKTLEEWWLKNDAHKFTSVSFLLDRNGVVRHIHPGGDIVKGKKDYEQLHRRIEELLVEN